MSAEWFLDTNVLIYTFDPTAPAKRTLARRLLKDSLDGRGVISSQVVQEFINLATRKFASGFPAGELENYLDSILQPLCRVFPSFDQYRQALDLQRRASLSFYDALIVTAAVESGARILYSEDMQHGQRFGPLEIRNPFRK